MVKQLNSLQQQNLSSDKSEDVFRKVGVKNLLRLKPTLIIYRNDYEDGTIIWHLPVLGAEVTVNSCSVCISACNSCLPADNTTGAPTRPSGAPRVRGARHYVTCE